MTNKCVFCGAVPKEGADLDDGIWWESEPFFGDEVTGEDYSGPVCLECIDKHLYHNDEYGYYHLKAGHNLPGGVTPGRHQST